jgi:3-carboxy-cis,cis-muconate cycloisomerase
MVDGWAMLGQLDVSSKGFIIPVEGHYGRRCDQESRQAKPEEEGGVASLAKRYRGTPMPGRTHLQQALPITFGYKAAVWLSMMDRHVERLRQLKPRVLVAQLGAAAGTLASLGDAALDVQKEFARELGVEAPVIT